MLLTAAVVSLSLLQQDPVSTAPAADVTPPPPAQLIPAPPPLAVPPPPSAPTEQLVAPAPQPSRVQPATAAPSAAATSGLPVGPQPYRPSPGVITAPGMFPSQPAPTPIPAAPAAEEDEGEGEVALPPGPRPYNSLPASPAPPAGRAPAPYVAPGAMADDVYEARVRGSAQAAQSTRGSLDGSWIVTGVDGARLYGLQLSDDGRGGVEGAWRDANGSPGLRSGFLSSASRDGVVLTLRFAERNGTQPVTITLRPASDGRGWTGAVDRWDGHRNVVMRPQ